MAVLRGRKASLHNAGGTQAKSLGSSSDAAIAAMQKYQYARHVDDFTNPEQIDAAMHSVSERAASWAKVDPMCKVSLLKEVKRRSIKCCMQLGRADAVATGFGTDASTSPVFEARHTLLGLMLCSVLASWLDATLRSIEQARDGTTPAVGDMPGRTTADGRHVLQVTGPDRPAMSALLRSVSGYVYLKPGCTPSQGVEHRAAQKAAASGVCFVLGAGNQPFLGVIDTLHMMFHDGHVACLKYHDTQAATAPFLEYVLEPLIAEGYLKTFHCDLDLTRRALGHERVCRVHITGSDRTHDAIAWGTGAEAEQRMATGDPLLKAPMTSELGNVTPVVIVPGVWTSADIRTAAKLVAFNMMDNAGSNCLAPKAVVLAADWPQADEFEAALKAGLAALPAAPMWYPGAKQLYNNFIEQHSACELIVPTTPPNADFTKPVVPWAVHTVAVGCGADAAAVPGLAQEFFAPVLTIVRLTTNGTRAAAADSDSVSDPDSPTSGSEAASSAPAGADKGDSALAGAFLRAMPSLLEEGLWGNLVAVVYAPTAVEAPVKAELQACLDDLRYGSVLLNMPSFYAYSLSEGVWGGFQYPETSIRQPGSGVGHISNVYCIDGIEKQVMRVPWGGQAPPASLPLPRFAVKGLAGLLAGGLQGVVQAALP